LKYPLHVRKNTRQENINTRNCFVQISSNDIFILITIIFNYCRGEVYVIAGTGGEDLYDLKSKADFIATQYKGFGFLNVDISSDGTKLVGTFYDNADGSIKDTFTITKLVTPESIPLKRVNLP